MIWSRPAGMGRRLTPQTILARWLKAEAFRSPLSAFIPLSVTSRHQKESKVGHHLCRNRRSEEFQILLLF
jgi:hypothetical protein